MSKSDKGVAPAGRLFTKKWKFLIFWGPHSHPPAPIDVKFCAAKRTQVPVGPAKFDRNRCNESPLRGENPDFWPVSKNNTGSLPLRCILPVIKRCTVRLVSSSTSVTFECQERLMLQIARPWCSQIHRAITMHCAVYH